MLFKTPEQRKLAELNGLIKRRERSIRGPFNYPGSKYNVLAEVLPRLPYRSSYIEPFGGTGVVLLSRAKCKLEVFNDRYSAITDFFKVLREDLAGLKERLELYLHSREEWERCLKTWHDPNLSRTERAARWYYALQYSFAGKMQVWARITKSESTVSGTMQKRIGDFEIIRARMLNVQIENLDWSECIKDYDHPGAVFYMDPPYYSLDSLSYRCSMVAKDHEALLERIMRMKGFVAISGVANDLYDSYEWDEQHTFKRKNNVNSCAVSEHNNRTEKGDRTAIEECLWIRKGEG